MSDIDNFANILRDDSGKERSAYENEDVKKAMAAIPLCKTYPDIDDRIAVNKVTLTHEQVDLFCHSEFLYIRKAMTLRNDITDEQKKDFCHD